MTSKKPHARHLPQRRGRKLKPLGPNMSRYGNGKIKNPEPKDDGEPNADVIAMRRRMLNLPNAKPSELRAADNPLDLAKARGWITPQEHQAGEMLIAAYMRAGLDLPRLRTQDLAREIRGGQSGSGDPRAMQALRECSAALQGWPKCTAALIDVCLLSEWPAWAIARINGTSRAEYEIGWVHLRVGLRRVAEVFGCGEAVGQEIRRRA